MRKVVCSLVVCLVAAGVAGAQTAPVAVTGVAFDSLHRVPLRGALVSLGSRSAMSDSLGVFRFDSVAPGAHRLTMQHDVLDSLGLSGIAANATVSDGRDSLRIAVPSFGTLWRRGCGTPEPPPDSGFVFGVVRDAVSHRPLANADVIGTWVDLSNDPRTGVAQKAWKLDTRSDSSGSFALCGLPTSTATRLQATTDSGSSGPVDVLLTASWRMQRRDLAAAKPSARARGWIVGEVRGDHGPIPDARILSEGLPETRTDSKGRFVIRDVPAGTRQLEAQAIGLTPTSAIVDVGANDTAHVALTLGKAVVLDSVKVKSTSVVRRGMVADYIDRKRTSATGMFRDSVEIMQHPMLRNVFETMPGVKVKTQGRGTGYKILLAGDCMANLWVDGIRMPDHDELSMVFRDQVAAVEVYPRGMTVPEQFRGIGDGRDCGSVVIWTKRAWP